MDGRRCAIGADIRACPERRLVRAQVPIPLAIRRRRSEARRLDILRAAARVFRRSGVAAAGMREIAEEADLSPGNLYYYGSSGNRVGELRG